MNSSRVSKVIVSGGPILNFKLLNINNATGRGVNMKRDQSANDVMAIGELPDSTQKKRILDALMGIEATSKAMYTEKPWREDANMFAHKQ